MQLNLSLYQNNEASPNRLKNTNGSTLMIIKGKLYELLYYDQWVANLRNVVIKNENISVLGM